MNGKLLIVMLFACLPALVSAEETRYKAFPEGVYRQGVFIETLPNGKDFYDNKWINRLTIQRLEPVYIPAPKDAWRGYFVNFQYAMFTPAHTFTCRFAGVFEQEKDRLRLTKEFRDAMKCDVYLTMDKKEIRVHDQYIEDDYNARKTNPNNACSNFCEGYGMTGIFPLKSKVKR